jgi:hypothetical protein
MNSDGKRRMTTDELKEMEPVSTVVETRFVLIPEESGRPTPTSSVSIYHLSSSVNIESPSVFISG